MLNTDMRGREKEVKQEKEQKEKRQTCILKYFLPLPDSFCSISQPLHPSILKCFFSPFFLCLSPHGYWRQLIAVCFSLFQCLIFSFCQWSVFVSLWISALNLHLHDAHSSSSMLLRISRQCVWFVHSSPLLTCTQSHKHTHLETTVA